MPDPAMPAATVAIVIINWNGDDHVLRCLESVAQQNYPRSQCHVAVIDNNSSDQSPELIAARFPDYHVIRNETNLGCAAAENQAIELSLKLDTDYLWLLNNDVVVDRECLANMIRVAESDSAIAVVGAAAYSYDEPSVEENLGYHIDFRTGRFKMLRATDDTPSDAVLQVDTVQGCAVLSRVSVFRELGMYRSEFEAYFEESDFHMRVRRAGHKVVTVRQAHIRHKKAASYNRVISRRAYLLLRNLMLFEWHNAPRSALAVFVPYYFFVYLPYFVIRGTIYALQHRVKSVGRNSGERQPRGCSQSK